MSESLISRTEHPAPYNDNDNDQVKVQVCLNQPRQLPRPPHLQQQIIGNLISGLC